MATSDKLKEIAENVPKVYDAGRKSQYDEFWNAYLPECPNSISYAFAGSRWTDRTFTPPRNIKIIANGNCANSLFYYSLIADLKGCLERQGIYLDATEYNGTNGFMNWFSYSTITHIGRILFPSTINRWAGAFTECKYLHTIDELPSSESTVYSTHTFQNCTALENITVTGEIGRNNFNVSWSTKLTHDSLMSIINALADKSSDTSGTTWEAVLGAENLAKLTEEEILIAENKGWNLG